ncbi:MAG: hypothetical protein KAI70_02155 [Candidatus Omnitrophica bacterium]|nr:hypothetical protein [Candidatus Omnitrophota bacterium]
MTTNVTCKLGVIRIVCFVVILVFGVGGQLWWMSQDGIAENMGISADEESAEREMDAHISGKVISVDILLDRVELLGDSDGASGRVDSYLVKPETTFTVAGSLQDISQGDRVAIDFYTFKEQRIAENIVLEKKYHKNFESKNDISKVLVD